MRGVSLSPIYARIQNAIDRLESGSRTPQIAAALKNLKAAGKDVRSSCPRTMTIVVAGQARSVKVHSNGPGANVHSNDTGRRR